MPHRRDITPEIVTKLGTFARLPQHPDRAAEVAPALAKVYGLIDQLDAADLAETPPATAFDARWK